MVRGRALRYNLLPFGTKGFSLQSLTCLNAALVRRLLYAPPSVFLVCYVLYSATFARTSAASAFKMGALQDYNIGLAQ